MTDRYSPPVAVHCVVEKRGQFLLQRRSAQNYFAPNCFGLPGGHIEKTEDPLAAARRETEEELAITVTSTGISFAGIVYEIRTTEPSRIHLIFHVTEWVGDPIVTEPAKHTELRWVEPPVFPVGTLAQAAAGIQLIQSGARYLALDSIKSLLLAESQSV